MSDKTKTSSNNQAHCTSNDPSNVYRVDGVDGVSGSYSFYDPRRPGYYLHLSDTMSVGMIQLSSDTAERMSLRRWEPNPRDRAGHIVYNWSHQDRTVDRGDNPPGPLYRCEGDCDDSRYFFFGMLCTCFIHPLTLFAVAVNVKEH